MHVNMYVVIARVSVWVREWEHMSACLWGTYTFIYEYILVVFVSVCMCMYRDMHG